MATLRKALEDASKDFVVITDMGTNSDGELSCISDAEQRFDLDFEDTKHDYVYLPDYRRIEETLNGEATGWYLQLSK